MNKLVLSAFVLGGLMFTSCKDDDKKDDDNVDISKMYLPLKIDSDDYSSTFTYNNKAQVTKIVESDGYEYIFNYAGDKLVEIITEEKYNDNSYKTTYTFSQSGTDLTLNSTEVYNGQSRTNTEILSLDGKGNLINDGYFLYSYDGNGNVIKMETEDGDKVTCKFDSKNGIFKNLNLPKWVITYILDYQTNISNNMIEMEYISEEYPEENNSGVIKYEYNTDGYPVKSTATSTKEGTFIQTIQYTKK